MIACYRWNKTLAFVRNRSIHPRICRGFHGGTIVLLPWHFRRVDFHRSYRSRTSKSPVQPKPTSDTMASTIPRITLSKTEALVKHLLLDVAAYINPQSPSELRFTGGWVRDKLLGVGSHDIDVGINDMTGYRFGLKMEEYLALPGVDQKYRLTDEADDKKSGTMGLHKIAANPEKSKHLETVTTRILGLDVDLVNLRRETYTEESRNPQMEFGKPQEDAMRRDATINAMFYNLRSDLVEDFTGKGWDDMKAQVIRTPLDPFQTFKDDPLRVLRLIRFASRLGYTIDHNAQNSMQDGSIKEALKKKISRERVGDEIGKMLKGNDTFCLPFYRPFFC